LHIVIARAGCVGRVICWLSRGLLRVLLIEALVPVAWLEGVPWLVKCILRAGVWDSSSGSYSLYHLSGFSVLYGLGLVLVVVFGHRRGDNCI
jgi:hypothetical protein